MGYTTQFTGEFRIVSTTTNEYDYLYEPVGKKIRELHMSEGWRNLNRKGPDSYCQWILYSDDAGDYLQWDGGEKFYYYKEWLQFILDEHLLPYGYMLEGEVRYQGEQLEDAGYLVIKDNQVVDEKLERKKTTEKSFGQLLNNDIAAALNAAMKEHDMATDAIIKYQLEAENLNNKIKNLELEVSTLYKVIERKNKVIEILLDKLNEPGKIV